MAKYHLRACAHDREGYYYPRWDKATPIVVEADSKQEAINRAARALGEPRGNARAWYWGFKVDRIEVTP